MTCIVALQEKNKIYMGADSCASDGFTKCEVTNTKCFIVDDFIIGCTSSFRMIDLLRYSLVIPKLAREEYDDSDKFMRTHFINAVRHCFKINGFMQTKDGSESGGRFLVGFKNKLYEVQDDFSILNRPAYGYSVGCGVYAARGSLWTTRNMKLTAKRRLTLALEAAAEVNAGVAGPFTIIEQK